VNELRSVDWEIKFGYFLLFLIIGLFQGRIRIDFPEVDQNLIQKMGLSVILSEAQNPSPLGLDTSTLFVTGIRRLMRTINRISNACHAEAICYW
jgi:hypothetical protein